VSWSVIGTLVPIHIYQCTKFQLHSSTSLGDTGIQKIFKSGSLYPRCP